MRFRQGQSGAYRNLAIGLLIASLIHIPLPQPDFHNVRHHDGPGEICEYHDHLIRWHPSANRDNDASVLHWHWILPAFDGSGGDGHEADDAQHQRPGSGPAFHANVGDGLEPDWSASYWLSSEKAAASPERLVTAIHISIIGATITHAFTPYLRHTSLDRSLALPHARSTPRPVLQRWNC